MKQLRHQWTHNELVDKPRQFSFSFEPDLKTTAATSATPATPIAPAMSQGFGVVKVKDHKPWKMETVILCMSPMTTACLKRTMT